MVIIYSWNTRHVIIGNHGYNCNDSVFDDYVDLPSKRTNTVDLVIFVRF